MRKLQTYQIETGATMWTITQQKFLDRPSQVVAVVPVDRFTPMGGDTPLAVFNWAMNMIFDEVAKDTEDRYEFLQVIQVTPEISRILFRRVPPFSK